MAPQRVDRTQQQEQQHRGEQEEPAGDQPPPGAVQQPAQVGGQLDGLRTRQQLAVIQGVQEAGFRDPAPLVHQFAVEHGDLAGGAAEAHQAQVQPETGGLRQAHGAGGHQGGSQGTRAGWCGHGGETGRNGLAGT